MDLDLMCDTLYMFIMEIRKQSGEEYPRETLYKIMLSLQNFLVMNGCTVKLLDHNSFIKLLNTLDNKMKELSSAGIIHHKKQAQPITLQQEKEMWQNGILGLNMPKKLVNMLLYLISVHFTLHVCDEHKNL